MGVPSDSDEKRLMLFDRGPNQYFARHTHGDSHHIGWLNWLRSDHPNFACPDNDGLAIQVSSRARVDPAYAGCEA